MKRIFSVAVMAAAASFGAAAQSLNPTVEVTNTYRGSLTDVYLPKTEMAVPDSLLQFRLDFDYDTFDTPYTGAYDFQPYLMRLRPTPVSTARNFYLKAGAGYTLHPELGVVFSPQREGRTLQWDIYDSMKSYFGDYHEFGIDGGELSKTGGRTGGYDFHNLLGVNARRDAAASTLTFGAGYDNLSTKGTLDRKMRHGLFANARLRSNETPVGAFTYDLGLRYSFSHDGQDYSAYGTDRAAVNEHRVDVDAAFGPVLSSTGRILIGVGLHSAFYGGAVSSYAAQLEMTPKYLIDKDRWHFGLGLRVSGILSGEDADAAFGNNKGKGQVVYPAVDVEYLAGQRLTLFATVGGGDDINTYTSMQECSHFFDPSFAREAGPLLENTVERVNASIGLKGNAASRLDYKIYGGYAVYDNAPVEAVFSAVQPVVASEAAVAEDIVAVSTDQLLPGITYCDYNLLYAGADLSLSTKSVDASGKLRFNHADAGDDVHGFMPGKLSGDVAVRYNWNRRLFVGASCGFETSRKGFLLPYGGVSNGTVAAQGLSLPSYVDLGASVEFRLSRQFGLWLEGGNLLNQTIHRGVLFAERGLSLTGGVVVSF